MKRTLAGGAAALLMGMSAVAPAAGPSWDHATISWILAGEVERPGSEDDLEGYRFDFTKSLGRQFFVRAAADTREADSAPNVDFSAHRIGIGARFPISGGRSPIELWGALNYERVVVEGSVGYGPGIDIGLRSQLTPQFDLDLAVKIFGDIDFDDFDADYTGYELTGAYKLRPDLSLLVSYGSYEVDLDGGPSIDLDGMISVGLRLHF